MQQVLINFSLCLGLITLGVLFCIGSYYWGWEWGYRSGPRQTIVTLSRLVGLAFVVYFGYRTTWYMAVALLVICMLIFLIFVIRINDIFLKVLFRINPKAKNRSRGGGLGSSFDIYDFEHQITGLGILIPTSIMLYYFIRGWSGGISLYELLFSGVINLILMCLIIIPLISWLER